MELKLSKKESLEFFHNALCNGLAYIGYYGIELDYDADEYDNAKAKLTDPAFEDVLIQILKDGGTLNFNNFEYEQDVEVTLQTVYDRVKKSPFQSLIDVYNTTDDAVTADTILQTVLYEEVIFG